jgi:hypothetical protein
MPSCECLYIARNHLISINSSSQRTGTLAARSTTRRTNQNFFSNKVFHNHQFRTHSRRSRAEILQEIGKNRAVISTWGGPASTLRRIFCPHPRHPPARGPREPSHSIAAAAPGRRPRRCQRPDRAAGAHALAGIVMMRASDRAPNAPPGFPGHSQSLTVRRRCAARSL